MLPGQQVPAVEHLSIGSVMATSGIVASVVATFVIRLGNSSGAGLAGASCCCPASASPRGCAVSVSGVWQVSLRWTL